MITALRALPGGLFWYPAVAIMIVLTVRSVLMLRPPARERPPRVGLRGSRYARYRSLIERATRGDRRGGRDALELERVCVGLLLLTGGYDGYSRAACRDYIASSARTELTDAVAEHLSGTPDRRIAAESGLTERCERILRAVEKQRS